MILFLLEMVLDKNSQLDLKNYLEKISNCEKPMIFGKALEGSLQGFWRYRVGKFRIICKIDNNKNDHCCY